MDNKLFFLSAADGRAMTKKFKHPQKSKSIVKESYPHVASFNSCHSEYSDIRTFTQALKHHANQGACLLKGQLSRELDSESRAGSTSPSEETSWICLDFDAALNIKNAAQALKLLGLSEIDYVIQYSASQGILEQDTFNAHIFLLLSEPTRPDLIKEWLRYKNLTVPALRNQIRLTKSHNALRWPLDITVNQNDKLIYIAPPEVYDGITDPIKNRIVQRTAVGNADVLDPQIFTEAGGARADKLQLDCLNELRVHAGLPKKKTANSKTYKGTVVLSNPDKATVTGLKEDRGYGYVNLNGGDSWAYYFSLYNPEILYNFKGEDNYALKDIAPELYKEYSEKAKLHRMELHEKKLKEQKKGLVHHAFLDILSDTYYRGTYCYDSNVADFSRTNSLVKVQHFLKQHGQEVGDFVPEWKYEFRFDDSRIFDPDERFVNRYIPSEYLKNWQEAPIADTPTIDKILENVVGNSDKALDYFLNWLAYIVQTRQPARTAWLFHGIQGTGKGVLFNYVLAPIIGRQYVQVKRLEEIEEDYNAFMQDCIFLLVDEIQLSNARHRDRAMAKLKNLITEPYVSIRAMRTDGYMAANNMNIIFASNKPDPIEIDPTDRRINVAEYQRKKLVVTHEEIEALSHELPSFTRYLMEYEVDERAAVTPMDSRAKRHIQYLTRTTIDLFSDALRDGNVRYFFDSLPAPSDLPVDPLMEGDIRAQRYRQIVGRMFAESKKLADGKFYGSLHISREELRVMAEFLIGKVPDSPNKFTSFIKHHDINVKPIKINNKTTQGLVFNGQIDAELMQEWVTHWVTDQERSQFKVIDGGKK